MIDINIAILCLTSIADTDINTRFSNYRNTAFGTKKVFAIPVMLILYRDINKPDFQANFLGI